MIPLNDFAGVIIDADRILKNKIHTCNEEINQLNFEIEEAKK